MFRYARFTHGFTIAALCLAACTGDGAPSDREAPIERAHALDILADAARGPVALETNEAGVARVLSIPSQFAVMTGAADPAEAAKRFLAEHHDVFELSAAEAASFTVTRRDIEPKTGHSHITLQRTWNDIPVFQGAITIHMNASNGVYRVVGDEFYRVGAPTNRQVLAPAEAAVAAARAVGLKLNPTFASSSGARTRFTAIGARDPIDVEPRIFQFAAGDDRFAYQATVSWLDGHREQHYELVLLDAQDGALLARHSLVNTFTGRVFTASPGANPTTDTRVVVSFDGNPAASPSGWVDSGRQTIGNNVFAVTDLNGDNKVGDPEVGGAEIQPTANASDSFDFPFSPLQNASNSSSAAVVSAFYLANDYHDRTYALGFTEAAGNFQHFNFGKGGVGDDEVLVDVEDASGSNNADFVTPPDGSHPRMQLYLFTLNGGPNEDPDFDPSIVYHESTHGLSNRLVGGGSTRCLQGVQSAGMGEGWGDFMAASFLGNPVIGAYVSGNASIGLRRASMANSPFTYANIKDGSLADVHDVGEVWAAALWDARNTIGAPTMEQLVVTGMKLTPCNPTMLQARDAIVEADANLYGGAHRCALLNAFAGRQMGLDASSPNHNSTSAIVVSSRAPDDCPLPLPGFSDVDEKFDLNGDGLADVCARGVAGVSCALSTGTSFGAATLWSGFFSDANNWALGPEYYSTIHFADLNGDGRADICGRGVAGVYCALSTGTGFGPATLWDTFFSDANQWNLGPAYYSTIQLHDVNHDGRADVCGRGRAGVSCALSTGTSFGAASLWSSFFSDANHWNLGPQYFSTIQFPDLNNDGRADICGRGITGVSCALSTGTSFGAASLWSAFFSDANQWNLGAEFYSTIQFPDVNHDGRADVCGRGRAGVSCALSTGSAFGAASLWSAFFGDANQWNVGPQYYSTIQFPDLNNDGRADICGRGTAGVSCAISTGTSFGAASLWSAFFGDANQWNVGAQYYSTLRFPDVSNDGRADICARGAAGVSCALSTGTAFGTASLWSSFFGDANGWNAAPQYYSTLRFP